MGAFKRFLKVGIILMSIVVLAGCTIILQRGRRSDIEKIQELEEQINELSKIRSLLGDRLKQEIKDKQVRLNMAKKGLVITFVADVLFDSGKAKLRSDSYPVLNKVVRVLKENVPENHIGIEGHTDNQPIRYSGWKSNWELSTARALSVLHFLVDEKGIDPGRVSAIGYGEYRPVASNDTREGKQLNRRVEIVILPRITKVDSSVDRLFKAPSQEETGLLEPQENLK